MENLTAKDSNDAEIVRGASLNEECKIHGIFHFECFDKEGNLKWVDEGRNIVTNQGKNGMMDSYLAGSPALAANWFMSLITAGTAIATSTYAVPTVTEITSGIVATRPTVSWSASSAGIKAATTTAFTIIGTATITGNMLVTATSSGSTIGNTAGAGGILFSSSAFSGGSKSVSSGDTLNVSYQLTI